MTWLDSRGQRWNVKVTAGRRGGKGIHIDTGGIEVRLLAEI